MKAYYYTPEECGFHVFPQGLLRLECETTLNPREADVFVIPPNLFQMKPETIHGLPYMQGNETKHVGLNVAERQYQTYGIPAIFFRCDCTKEVLSKDPTTISWSWPVEDLSAQIPLPQGGFKYDVVFKGWISTDMTDTICDSVLRSSLNCFIERSLHFFGHMDQAAESTKKLRRDFLDTLSASRLSLVPRSLPAGIVRYRFYEAMSAARVPVHFCDNCVMPFADRIDYSKCSITIAESDASNAGEVLSAWLKKHSDSEIVEMGKYGRAMYERWLCHDRWNALFTEVVKGRLGYLDAM